MQRRFLSLLVIGILAGQIIAMSPLRAHLSTPVSLMEAEAQELEAVEEVLIERGHTSAIYDLGGNQRRAVLGLDPWVLDESAGQYVPHLLQDFGNSTVNVKSGMIGWKIGPESAVIADPELTEERTREVWRIYLEEQELEKQFVTQTVSDFEGKVQVLNRYDTDIDGSRAALTISYLIHDGRPTERVVQINGVSDDLKSQVRIEREWRDIDTDELLYSTADSQSRDSVSLQRKSISPTERGEYVRLMKGDKMIVHENLRTAGDKLKNVEYERGLVMFGYSGFDPAATVRLTDDTYSDANPVVAGRVLTASATGTSCGAVDSIDTATRVSAVANDADLSVTGCMRGFAEWDISSIPTNATVSDVDFKFHVIDTSGLGDRDVEVRAVTGVQPSTGSASDVWNEIGGGTTYVASLDETTGTNKSQDLGTSADSDVEAQLAGGWFAIATMLTSEMRVSGTGHAHSIATDSFDFPEPEPTLEVVYTVPAAYDRTPSDSFTLSDSIGVSLVAARSTDDSKSFSEAIAIEYSANRAIADTRTFTDSAARKLSSSRAINDSKTFSDSIAIGLDASRSASDTATISDSITTSINRDVQVNDSSTISDSIAAQLDASRSINDTTTIADNIQAVYTEAVEIPITLNAGSGSPTFEAQGVSASISCEYGGSHDGDPAQQEFQCFESETVTIALPAGNSTERWVWSDGTTSNKQFTACETGICDEESFTYYLQEKQIITLDGLDAVRTASITRTQQGSTGTTATSGSTQTEIWADYGTAFDIPDTVIVVSEENRFKSYDSSSDLSYNVTSANTKTITYQHEFNMLFRVHEEHLGHLFIPMPDAVYTGTITTSNSTQLALTFDIQVTDDHLQPSQRYWVANGTTSWTDITWRNLIANATGSAPITEYGNFDIESEVAHYGYEGNRHFRVGVDGGTIDSESAIYDDDAATFEFEAMATGTKTAKVEFLTTIYSAVNDVRINGTSFDSSNWSVQDLGDDLTGVVTINNIEFSTNTITVYFSGSGSSNPSSGGGGGGGGGTTPGGTIFDPQTPALAPLSLNVRTPSFIITPGSEPVTQTLRIEWTGGTSIIVNEITFSKHADWFTVNERLPLRANLDLESQSLVKEIPITINIPPDEQFTAEMIDVTIVASNGVYTATTVQPMTVAIAPSADIGVFVGIGIVILIGISAIVSIKNRGLQQRTRPRRSLRGSSRFRSGGSRRLNLKKIGRRRRR